MTKRSMVHAGVVGMVMGWLVLLTGCQSAGEDAAEPQAIDVPVAEQVETQADEVAESPAVVAETPEVTALTLKFVPGQRVTYKVTSAMERTMKWEGNMTKKPPSFKDGRTAHRVEMTFDQRVERITEEGDAVIQVTITALRYQGEVHERMALDFDSVRAEDRERPLAKLIGQSYRVEMTPQGVVIALRDLPAVRETLQGDLLEYRTALKLVSDRVTRERHEVPALMALKSPEVRPEAHWSNLKAFSFDMMGAKTFERIYTFEGVESRDERSTAVVAMEGVLAAPGTGQSQQAPVMNPFASMTDNTDDYTGQLKLDLSTGQIEDYAERFQTEWVVVDPASVKSGDPNPAVLKMGARESYQLERVD